jgi:DNA helicase-2/ATP-dependent DNA helicase PcrA
MVPLRFHVTQQHRFGDRHLYGGLSRFVTPAVAEHFERVASAAPAQASAPAALATLPAIDLAQQMRAAWD